MIGAGTTFSSTTDDGTTWDLISKIKAITFPDESREVTEDSYIDEINIYKEKAVGKGDAGELQITLKWNVNDTQQVLLDTRFETVQQAAEKYQVKFPDNTTYTVTGYVSGRGREVTENETITKSFTIALTGAPQEVAGA